MRKLLVLAFLLCKSLTLLVINVTSAATDVRGHNYITDDIIAIATRPNNYDYDDVDGSKRHYLQQMEDRRNWRKKALAKAADDHRDREWDRRRYEYDNQRYMDDTDSKSYNAIERQREMDVIPGFRDRHRKYDDVIDKMQMPSSIKSAEVAHASSLVEKDMEKKLPLDLNCQRPHEKYESCFAGCASVTCDNPRDRMQPCYPFCEAGCVCVLPYVRDDRTHKCVLPEDCTKGLKGIPDLGEEATS